MENIKILVHCTCRSKDVGMVKVLKTRSTTRSRSQGQICSYL
jgi:hypothetical protein